MSESQGDKAERLLKVALELAMVVREEDRAGIERRLRDIAPGDKDALIVCLAALVPLDQPVQDLLGWVDWQQDARARATSVASQRRPLLVAHAEYERLRARGVGPEQMPDWVRQGQRAYDRRRRPGRRAAA